MMQMYIKESYVYAIVIDGKQRWVGCNGGSCGYERTIDDSNNAGLLYRMFKVNGEQICEVCLDEWRTNISIALYELEEEES